MNRLKRHAVEIFTGGGIMLFTYNFLFGKYTCPAKINHCINELHPWLYLISIALIIIGVSIHYNKKNEKQ